MSEYPANSRMQAHQKRKRFLFIVSDTGGGHRASANAVKDALISLYHPYVEVQIVDLFIEMDQWPFDRFPDWYPQMVGKNGLPWAFSFYLSNGVRLVKAMSRIVWPYARHALCEVLRQHPADEIVSFHPIPNYGLQMALRYMGWKIPVATVAVDMVTAHASWFVPGANLYLVPTEEARKLAIRWGIAPELVYVTGMPTRRVFAEAMALPKTTARAQLKIPQEKDVVLIVGGGEGMGPLSQVVREIAHKNSHLHIIVIAGRNKSLYDELTHAEYADSIHVQGFVNNMEVWMRAADILVTKAGPNTLAEAFIAGLPLVLCAALPGQEEGNITHVVSHGAGFWAPQPKVAASAVEYLHQHPVTRARMATQSQALARPLASREIATQLWNLIVDSGAAASAAHEAMRVD